MIHDFAITEHHLVLLLGPAVLDVDAMLSGGRCWYWKPELGTRIAVIARDGFAGALGRDARRSGSGTSRNAYERDGNIELDFPEWNQPGQLTAGAATCRYVRARLDPRRGTISSGRRWPTRIADFPRIDDRRLGRAQRYTVLTANSGDPRVPHEHDLLCRADLESGDVAGARCRWRRGRTRLRAAIPMPATTSSTATTWPS